MTTREYMLNVGTSGATRLSLVQEIYGPSSRAWLTDAGLAEGAHVLELGCGSGTMTQWIAERVGATGRVVGVDRSAAQLETARRACAGSPGVTFLEASASDTGLPEASFDLVYLRLLLMHVPDPSAVLAHARSLLRVGGVIVCEEAAVGSTSTDPEVLEQAELHALAAELARERGVDYDVARRLGSLAVSAGFVDVAMRAHTPIFLTGAPKLLEVLSFREALSHWTSASAATRARGEQVCVALEAAAHDPSVAYGLSTMTQLRARRDR